MRVGEQSCEGQPHLWSLALEPEQLGEGAPGLGSTGLWMAFGGQHLELGRPGWEWSFTTP